MTRVTIIKRNINDNLWPKVVLEITYFKNIRPTRALGGDDILNQL